MVEWFVYVSLTEQHDAVTPLSVLTKGEGRKTPKLYRLLDKTKKSPIGPDCRTFRDFLRTFNKIS